MSAGRRPGAAALPAALALLALAAPSPARGASPCPASSSTAASSATSLSVLSSSPGSTTSSARRWPAPLDRSLRFHARDISLRDALDRLAAAARLRVSYSADLLPLDRRVCVSRDASTVGDVLAELLGDAGVEAVVAGSDHVVLAPRRGGGEVQAPTMAAVALEGIVATGSASGAPQGTLPVALDVIRRPRLERAGAGPLTRVLGSSSAGPWAWEQAPASLTARYGSIRGASSFGVSHPKVFIDGIEVANPLLVTRVAPEAVERIEVIRGPQGSALHGTDAISGVVHIVTRHETADGGAPRVRVRSGVGMARSEYAPDAALAQDHAVSVRGGRGVASGGLNLSFGSVGEYVPDGASRHVLASANGRWVGARTIVTGTARFYDAASGGAASPLLPPSVRADSGRLAPRDSTDQRVRQYTFGVTARHMPDGPWTHAVVAGVDGDRTSGVLDDRTPIPSAAEAALRSSEGSAARGTLRASSVGRFAVGRGAEVALTFAAEHSVLRERTLEERAPRAGPGGPGPQPPRPREPLVSWTRSTGALAQATASHRDRLHLTAGLRVERNDGLTGGDYAALPALGAAWVARLGEATLKLRTAYGKGIRPARTASREMAWAGSHPQLRAFELAPEEQSGIEGGFDLTVGRSLSVGVTRYDQLASGLIQRVVLPFDTTAGAPRRASYLLQNVGQISNRGWELQAGAERGGLSLSAAASFVDSRVRRLAAGYGGDLRTGDRMLEVPARTLSLSAGWTGSRASASVTAYRASDWINYDRLALAHDFATRSRPDHEMAGDRLRTYWRTYEGVTRLNATASVGVRRGLELLLTGSNLLDRQRGEPDNLSVVPGRTVTLGLRAEL